MFYSISRPYDSFSGGEWGMGVRGDLRPSQESTDTCHPSGKVVTYALQMKMDSLPNYY